MTNIWDVVNSLSETKEYIFHDVLKRDYQPYIINQAFSYYPDTIFLVNELNKCNNVSSEQHYDFLFYALPKRKRRSKWFKPEKSDLVEGLCRLHNISRVKMEEILAILEPEEINRLQRQLEQGG